MKTLISPLLALIALTYVARTAPPEVPKPNQGPFRVVFAAYDGPTNDPAKMTFQINTLDLRQPSEFLKIGDIIPRTRFRLVRFTAKEIPGNNGRMEDVSELVITNSVTGKTVVLIIARVINAAEAMQP